MKKKITRTAWFTTALIFIALINLVWGIINAIRLCWNYDETTHKIFIVQVVFYFGMYFAFKKLGKKLKKEAEEEEAAKLREKTIELMRKNEKYGI